jgi:hypothetical protein
MSSWKCRLTPRSIFLRSEYLISLFLAASCIAALTSFRAIPWRKEITCFFQKWMEMISCQELVEFENASSLAMICSSSSFIVMIGCRLY